MNRALSGRITRMLPGVALLAHYRRAWLSRDLYAGIALSAVLVPVGMSYAQAAGLPAITGLYASIAALLAYALLGPSRILVLGPDSALAALIAGAIVPLAAHDPQRAPGRILVLGPDSALAALIAGAIAPLAAHDPQRAIALSGALALSAGAICILLGALGLGFVTDLLSRPIQYGYLNGIAIALVVGRLPELFSMPVSGSDVFSSLPHIVHAFVDGRFSTAAGLLGVAVLATIILIKRVTPRWPGILIAVLAATLAARLPSLHGVATVGALPAGTTYKLQSYGMG